MHDLWNFAPPAAASSDEESDSESDSLPRARRPKKKAAFALDVGGLASPDAGGAVLVDDSSPLAEEKSKAKKQAVKSKKLCADFDLDGPLSPPAAVSSSKKRAREKKKEELKVGPRVSSEAKISLVLSLTSPLPSLRRPCGATFSRRLGRPLAHPRPAHRFVHLS